MNQVLMERVQHLVAMYHKVDKESEASGDGWDTVLYRHGLDAVTGYCALRELTEVAGDYCMAELLREEYGTWAAHPDYPMADWGYEVANGDTRLGYWEWVVCRLERDSEATEPDSTEPS